MRARDNQGRYTASPCLNIARALRSIALLRSQPEMTQRWDGEWRWVVYLWLEDEAA